MPLDHKNTTIALSTNPTLDIAPLLKNLEDLDRFATFVSESDTLSAQFKKNDKDGHPIPINKSDIVACVLIGNEIGLSPILSLQLGSRINPNSILAVQRGREMGLSSIDALEQIHILIDKKTGKITTHTGLHVVKASLLRAGITHRFITNYAPVYKYITPEGIELRKDEVFDNDGEVKRSVAILDPMSITEGQIKEATDKNKDVVLKTYLYHESRVVFTRNINNETITREYSFNSDEARSAGYLPAQTADGVIDGRPSWIRMPHRMFPKEVYIYGARDIADDILRGMLVHHEAAMIMDVDAEEVFDEPAIN